MRPRLGIVVQREEHGPAESCSRQVSFQVAGSQHGDRGVSESLSGLRRVATVLPLRRLRPIRQRLELAQALTAACLDSHNGPAPIVGKDLASERSVGIPSVVALMSPHPSRRLPVHTHQSHPVVQTLRPCRTLRTDGLEMPALGQQQRGGRRASEPGAELVRPWTAFTQPELAILRTPIQVFGTPQRYPQQEAVARRSKELRRGGT